MKVKNSNKEWVSIIMFFISISLFSQSPNDCSNAVFVCSNGPLNSNANGIGVQEINSSNSCESFEHNSLWLRIGIVRDGTLGFTLTPLSQDLNVDYDFFVYGPDANCDDLGSTIRCSTTNPLAAGLNYNTTGMNDNEMDTYEGPGADGNSFIRSLDVTAGESYFIVIDRPIGSSPFSLEWTGSTTIGGSPFPERVEINKPNDLIKFNSTGNTAFDLTATYSEITSDLINNSISFYTTIANAVDGINPLDSESYTNTSNPQTVFARVVNNTNGCFEITNFNLIVDTTIPDLELCDIDEDNTELFNLSSENIDILNGLDPSVYNISYHLTQIDAEMNLSTLPNLYASSGETIFTKFTNTNNNSNYFIKPLNLVLLALPSANNSVLLQCDVDVDNSIDGLTSFNLEQASSSITGNTPDLTVIYYESITNRNNDTPIINPIGYTNTIPFSQIIYVKVIDLNGCTNYTELELQIQSTTTSLPIRESQYACVVDITDSNLQGVFNLQAIKNNIYLDLDATFYTTLNDAVLELNQISGSEYLSESTTIYVRIENSNQCQGIEQLNLILNEAPQVNIEDDLICLNQLPKLISAEEGFDNYRWYRINADGSETLYSSEQTANFNEAGTYRLELVFEYINSICSNSKNFTLTASSIAIINQASDISDSFINHSITVFVEGEGQYEYALNNINGPYQDSHIFENVPAGFSTVYIRDKNGCGITSQEVTVIGYPKFFTPNNDGKNDYWNIQGLSQSLQQNTRILIYDRYGKLLKQVFPNTLGWDGTYRGQHMHESDYWFVVELEGGRNFKGHFSLKR